jgi:hypothetical protein
LFRAAFAIMPHEPQFVHIGGYRADARSMAATQCSQAASRRFG